MEQTSPADRQNVTLDSHCHAWRLWPYPPLVPDENSRGTIEQVMHEMDMHGVEQAAVVSPALKTTGTTWNMWPLRGIVIGVESIFWPIWTVLARHIPHSWKR